MAQLADLQRAGVVAPWVQAFPGMDDTVRWVGVPGMNALAPRMLWGAEVHLQTAVTGIGRDRFGWWLETEAGSPAGVFRCSAAHGAGAAGAFAVLERVADVDTQPLPGLSVKSATRRAGR
jgi:renalase